ncbi:DUF3786 domain-containing protein [Desulfoprunum benzoelyticum]|uniref:4Fe-4S domain-containing protein n=1 Tax=Desulfoprunum benzoelyticum TaxID=1506996 RepID=A0A840UNX4_9BACT|nr:DUF3786 domain-containing protein [Desulfoprunum benzoelyticum]MBB5347957.1 hypothetical protein [Desulfoprunum benzoelyticum]MBM9530374.1 DUF3786 domain-containing protein [Desulfoprunum benzoelyticum]
MSGFANAMEVFSLLDRSNCRRCGEKTCMAFAGAVFLGMKALSACPKLDAETCARYGDRVSLDQEKEEQALSVLIDKVRRLDPVETAARTGGKLSRGSIVLKVLGKDFGIDAAGNFVTDIHVNNWVVVPFLTYLLQCSGEQPSGTWIAYREIAGGRERYPLFQKRCEDVMKQVADTWPDLFDDIVHLFGGERVAAQFDADISVVLRPLPKVPVMICYWKPAEGLASELNVFFDATVERFLDAGAVFNLGAGLARMFEVLAQRHGFVLPAE